MPVRHWPTGMLFLIVLIAWISLPANAATLRVATGPMGAGVVVRQPVRSVKELREENVVIQGLDYSCGSAALATIFSYYFGDPVSEPEVIEYILSTGNLRAIVERRGFSLLELKHFAESRGATAEGFGMGLEALAGVADPVVVPMRLTERLHFAIVRGVRGNRVFLADPALGKWTMSTEDFDRVWSPKVGLIVAESGIDTAASPLAIGEQDQVHPDTRSLRTLILPHALSFTPKWDEF